MVLSKESEIEFIQIVKDYIILNHSSDLERILKADDATANYSITAQAADLLNTNVEIFEAFFSNPRIMSKVIDVGTLGALLSHYHSLPDKSGYSIKDNTHVRLVAFPRCPEVHKTTLPRTCDVNKFQIITGTAVRVTSVKLLEYRKEFKCCKCKHSFQLEADIQKYFSLDKPSSCPNPAGCYSKTFHAYNASGKEPTFCKDYQEVKIQELLQNLRVGTLPRTMWVVMYDDLVDTCKPGNDVQISGVVLRRWRPLVIDSKSDIELVLLAHNVEVLNNQSTSKAISDDALDEFNKFWDSHKLMPLEGRNDIIASICPQVYGLYLVKLAVTLILAGGVQRIDQAGSTVRGEPHLLLIGDPGTAKSQFLKFAAKISPRSVLTTGIGTTSAGLTVTAIRDGSEWQLEAGALVMADSGVCCIDEFNSIHERDRASIHEAMEQQTISVAKAGIVCKLNTKCSVIAATNLKSGYDSSDSLSVNTAIASPLLSRFDLILMLEDQQNEEWDKLVSSYVLKGKNLLNDQSKTVSWNLSKLKDYFSTIKLLQPTLSEDAKQIILKYYQALRGSDTQNCARTTIRLLDSLIRLVQAHARIMYRKTVEVLDVIAIVTLMEASMQGSALIQSTDVLHASFPEDTELEYIAQLKMVLTKLHLNEILVRELERIEAHRLANKTTTEIKEQTSNRVTDKSPNICLTFESNEPETSVRRQDVTKLNSTPKDLNHRRENEMFNISREENRKQTEFTTLSAVKGDSAQTKNVTVENISVAESPKNHKSFTTFLQNFAYNRNSKKDNESIFQPTTISNEEKATTSRSTSRQTNSNKTKETFTKTDESVKSPTSNITEQCDKNTSKYYCSNEQSKTSQQECPMIPETSLLKTPENSKRKDPDRSVSKNTLTKLKMFKFDNSLPNETVNEEISVKSPKITESFFSRSADSDDDDWNLDIDTIFANAKKKKLS